MATATKAAKAANKEPKRIASFEEACKKLGIIPKLPDVSILPTKHSKAIIAHYQLVIIAQALNEGWEPNWDDSSEWKYYPWFDLEKATTAGSGFAFGVCADVRTFSDVGSRLCFRSRELAVYAGETFLDMYKDYFVIAE